MNIRNKCKWRRLCVSYLTWSGVFIHLPEGHVQLDNVTFADKCTRLTQYRSGAYLPYTGGLEPTA